MPNVGDTKDRFGRQYVYLNPDPSTEEADVAAVGHWRIAKDDSGTPPVDGGGGGNTDLSFRAPVAADSPSIAVGHLVYIDINGDMRLADASTYDTSVVSGMAVTAGDPGQLVNFTRNEVETIFNINSVIDGAPGFLTPGDMYYLSTTPGKWTTTPDTTTAGAVVRVCGTAVSQNDMSVEIQTATVI
mgnify:CR=1 FL=1